MIELLSCPFCGGTAELEKMGWPHHVFCIECGAKTTSGKLAEEGEQEAIEKWNRRVKQLLKKEPQWHPFDPLEPDDTGLKDHNFYLVTVKGFGTPMKAKYHIDQPFGFSPPLTKDFDPYDVIAWRELPDNMDEE